MACAKNLLAQHQAIGLPSVIVAIPYPCPNDIYEARMASALVSARRDGVTHVIFGDLFLEDVRAYREQKLAGTGITPLFPLWQRPTDALARDMIMAGVETYLVCVDLKQLPKSFAGRRFDDALLAELPGSGAPCGGEGWGGRGAGGGVAFSFNTPHAGAGARRASKDGHELSKRPRPSRLTAS